MSRTAKPIRSRRDPGRRCSNRSRRGHVTLGDVEERTRQVLKQILLERYPDKMGLLPAAVSGQLVR